MWIAEKANETMAMNDEEKENMWMKSNNNEMKEWKNNEKRKLICQQWMKIIMK